MQDVTDNRTQSPAGAPDAADRPFRYWAFISYSRHDVEAAKRLHGFLETYRIPRALVGRVVNGRPLPRRLVPVFRDRDELAGAASLSAKLREALEASATLIVLCSPFSATSKWVDLEIRDFKLMGRGSHIVPLILSGEPNASDNPDIGQPECFPPSLRFELDAAGQSTGVRCEPLAADGRPGMDGWRNACLKLIAGILGIGFDELNRRDQRRQRRRKALSAVAGFALAIVMGLGYVGLADAELDVPGARGIRDTLDRYGFTLFRPVMTDAELHQAASEARTDLRAKLLRVVASNELTAPPLSGWGIGQVAGALLRDRNSTDEQVQPLFDLLDLLFRSDGPDKPEGHHLLENVDAAGVVGRGESVLWSVMALANAFERSKQDDQRRSTFERYLVSAQTIAGLFSPLADGGWNTASNQVESNNHYVYTTGIALHMLLELRRVGLGWRGSKADLDRMIADTSGWLAGRFISRGKSVGWRRSYDDDKQPDDGLSLLIYSALGRACAEAGLDIPDAIFQAGLATQIGLRRRPANTSDPDIRFDVRVKDAAGTGSTRVTITRMIWYPWAVEGLVHWKACAAARNLPSGMQKDIDRSLTRLLGETGSAIVEEAASEQTPSFVPAEIAYGLGRVP